MTETGGFISTKIYTDTTLILYMLRRFAMDDDICLQVLRVGVKNCVEYKKPFLTDVFQKLSTDHFDGRKLRVKHLRLFEFVRFMVVPGNLWLWGTSAHVMRHMVQVIK